MSPVFAVSVCLVLLAAFATVSVRSQLSDSCPANGAWQLDKCLTTLNQLSLVSFTPVRCLEALEAWKCARTLVMACIHSDSGILMVLSSHPDLSTLLSSKSLSMCL